MKNPAILFLSFIFFLSIYGNAQNSMFSVSYDTTIVTGAERIKEFVKNLETKRVGVVANQTSVVGNTHLIDSMLSLGVDIKKVFSPEHGFRGTASAGELVKSSKDVKTGLPIVSLYGKNKKPTKEQLADIDIIVFDIQDVGARFYTYNFNFALRDGSGSRK